MRTRLLFTLCIAVLLILSCGKDDKVTGPDDSDGNDKTQPTSLKFVNHAVYTDLPNSVVMMFQIVDLENSGADFLTLDRFQIFEQGQLLNHIDASAFLLKSSDVNYVARTRILIDNNTGTNLAALKKGALELIDNADSQQEFGIYTVSDQLEKVQNFTRDKATLTTAINGITEGAAPANIYGSIMQVNREGSEHYTLEKVQQNMLVIFTDSQDDVGEYPIDAVAVANRTRRIYTVGYGGIDATEYSKLGTDTYFAASDEAGIVQAAADAQDVIATYMHSFYWLAYRSTLRGASSQEIKLTILGNTYSDEGSELLGNFDSNSFVDVDDGLYVNWSHATPDGVDIVMVMVDKERNIQVLTMGGSKIPQYTFTVADENIATATGFGGGRATVSAKGADGDSTLLTITDTTNGLTKEVTIKIVNFQIGVVLFEKWENLTGTAVSNLTSDPRFPANPTVVEELTSWEIPTDVGDNYGTRIRGFIHPPQTGNYTFWIASDDASELKLSSDDNPENAVRICNVSSYTGSREWTKEGNQKSAAIALEAGKAYYMESLHNEGTGGDNCAVAWSVEGGAREVIGSDFISKWIGE